MIIDFIFNFLALLGIVWLFLMILSIIRATNNIIELEKKVLHVDKDNVIHAEAEYVEQSNFKGYLIFELKNNSFLAQGFTEEECKEILSRRFPGKTILIKGFSNLGS